MEQLVSITRYEKPFISVREAVLRCRGLEQMPPGARVFIKPNIVYWTRACPFPKWGVITTSRVVEDMVILLKEHGVKEITIGEGLVSGLKEGETAAHAFQTLGYEKLKRRYGIKILNLMERPFEKVDLGDSVTLNFNRDILHSDFVVNLPVMKCHNQTVVSLGIKNLKGTIDISSRKKCHSADPGRDLHFHIARLADRMPPMLTLIDGIYTLARGPAFDGRPRRSNLLIASADILAADLVGAKVLGYEPAAIPYLAYAAGNRNRPPDLSGVNVTGEKIAAVASFHEYDFTYSSNEAGEMPLPLARQGITGLFYRKYDHTMCTYCSELNGLILSSIRQAWNGAPFDRVEVLTGKAMQPSPGMNATLLIGQCMYKKNRNHPAIKKMIAVRGCPPAPREVAGALQEAGIAVDPALFSQIDILPGFFMSRYRDKPEFDESFFQVQ